MSCTSVPSAPTVSTLADEGWRKTCDRSSFDVQWDQRLTTRVVTTSI
ncbi:MAG: hypothetical protein R2806_23695 [Saprospiraceae bacterium]